MNGTALGWEIITLIILEESAICCNEKQRRVCCESMGFNHVTFYLIEYQRFMLKYLVDTVDFRLSSHPFKSAPG